MSAQHYDPDTEKRVSSGSKSEFGLLAETDMANRHLTPDAMMAARGYRRKEGGGWELIPGEEVE